MAITLNLDPMADLDYTLNGRAAHRFKLVTGSFDYGATAGGGVSMDISHLNTVVGVYIDRWTSRISTRLLGSI
jgi:hypothetical protein